MGIRYTLRKATQSLRFSSIVPARGNDWTTVFMIHKRELSDSMIESGSSLFYCVPHHQQNPDRVFAPPGFLYRFFLNPFGVVSASGLILLKGQASTDIRPVAHVAFAMIIISRRDDRSVRFQAYRVIIARRDSYSKRGLETRVSLKKALEALGFPLNMRYADTTEGRLIPIPHSRPAEDFFFGCRADGRSALLVRFAAVWAVVRQRLCFKAVFC